MREQPPMLSQSQWFTMTLPALRAGSRDSHGWEGAQLDLLLPGGLGAGGNLRHVCDKMHSSQCSNVVSFKWNIED